MVQQAREIVELQECWRTGRIAVRARHKSTGNIAVAIVGKVGEPKVRAIASGIIKRG